MSVFYSEKKKIWNGKINIHSRFFYFHYFRETRTNTFLKNTPTPRDNQLRQAYFLRNRDGMSDQNRWHSRKASKIKASSGFWGRFSKPQKIQFYRWHSVFGVKKRFSGSEMKKNLTAFFHFWKSTKKWFPKYNHFLKKFFRQILKENVIKVPKVKLYEHPEVFKKLNTEEMIYFYKS